MFESVLLGNKMEKKAFKENEAELREQLLLAQQALKENKTAILIIVAGMDGAGKGDVIDRLNKWLDTRNIQVHAFWNSTDEERERPAYWRYWRRMPAKGTIGIFFSGWYWKPLRQFGLGSEAESEFEHDMRLITETESMLHDDGMLIIKLWFHLDEKSQKQILKIREEETRDNPILREDKNIAKLYHQFTHSAERMIRMTDSVHCPWHLIEAKDSHYRDFTAGQFILKAMHKRLNEHRSLDRRRVVHNRQAQVDPQKTVLDQVEQTAQDDKNNHKRLKHYQDKLDDLAWKCFDKKRSVVLLFEGWDAAGKGGAIRRLTDPIDARLFRVISIAAPTDEELAHHYLWRFWRHLPRAGYFTMYDRSWYGRVLVERVEGFAQQDEWGRAYQEINDFEEQLVDHGIILQKFWLHIDKNEQMRRFEARQQIPWKQHKITEEDWRNRDKWDQYKLAIHEMIARTSTDKAPWIIIPANDKNYARLEVVRSVCDTIEKQLKSE